LLRTRGSAVPIGDGINGWDGANAPSRPKSDYYLNFSSAEHLARELTPARLKLLEVLKPLGPVSIEGLAKQPGRTPALVQTDTAKLLDLGLVEQDTAGRVFVPWEEIEIDARLTRAAAA